MQQKIIVYIIIKGGERELVIVNDISADPDFK